MIPSNSEIFRDEFKKIIEFSLLAPEPLIKMIFPGFDLMIFIKGADITVTDEDQNASVLKDLKIYIFMTIIIIFVIIALSVFKHLTYFKVKIEEKLLSFKK